MRWSKTKKVVVITSAIVGAIILALGGIVFWMVWTLRYGEMVTCKDTLVHFGDNAAVQIMKDFDNAILLLRPENGDSEFPEQKIYSYKCIGSYLYTINKWDRYTVVNVETVEVVMQTEEISEISTEHREVFEQGDFLSLQYIDDVPKFTGTIELGDGTIYLEKWVSEEDLFYLRNEKSATYDVPYRFIEQPIDYYKQDGNLLYLIGEEGSYYIVDIEMYEVILVEDRIEDIEEDYKAVFEGLDTFVTKQETIEQMVR